MALTALPEQTGGIRGFVNRYPQYVGTAALLIGALALLFSGARHRDRPPHSYYTTDDGQTVFTQETRIPPFDHYGKEAVGVMMFSCDGGKTKFVGYLYRYTAEGKPKAEEMLRKHIAGPPMGMEVKKPGAGQWFDAMAHGPDPSTTAASITNVKCPDDPHAVPLMINPD